MAVWPSPTFKVGLAQALGEISIEVATTILGPTLAPFLAPDERTCGLAPTDSWGDAADVLFWKKNLDEAEHLEVFRKDYADASHYAVGTAAIYELVSVVLKDRFDVRPAHAWGTVDEILDNVGTLASYTTQANPVKFKAQWGRRDENLKRTARRLEDACEAFKFMRYSFGKMGETPIPIDQAKFFGSGRRVYYGHSFGAVVMMKGASEYVNKVLVFTRGHLDFLIGALSRLSNTFSMYSFKYHDSDGMATVVDSFLRWQVETAAKAHGPNAYKAARAMHKARTLQQMVELKSEVAGALESELADYVSDGLDQIVNLETYNEFMGKFSLLDRLELAHAYKWMPAPDYDVTSAFAQVKDWHHNTRASGADPTADPQAKDLWERIKAERLYHTLLSHKRATGSWPAGTPLVKDKVNVSALRGLTLPPFKLYFDLGKDIVSQIKDKATVPALAENMWTGKSREGDRSYLLWYLANSGTVDTVEAKLDFANGMHREDNYAVAAYKAESHKPGSRLFFMLPPILRTILGEFEANLSKVAEHYPGSLMGKGTSAKSKILNDIMDLYTDPKHIPVDADYEVFVVTFDLSKFSPKSNYNVTADYHKFWASVYGRPELAAMVDIGCKSTIMHVQDGVKMRYKNPGADLEGFRGRMMTMFHADLLGASVRLARERGVSVGQALLGIFIDDGSLKVALAKENGVITESASVFLAIMREVYAAGGQDNNPSKTLISKVGGEMLADLYAHGLKVPAGLKATQRIYPSYDNAAATLPEEFDSLAAASQGAVKDGGDWMTTYAMYAESLVKAISRWVPREFRQASPVALSLKLITPKSLGGFGMVSMQSLMTTAGVNATSEGLGMLNSVARQIPMLAKDVRRIVTKPVVIRDALSILRDPLRIRTTGVVMVENRLTMSIVGWLEKNAGVYAKFMAAYRDQDLIAHARAVAEALLSTHAVNAPALNRAWKTTPLAYVESVVGKFKRSSTIVELLGHRALNSIRKKNKDEVRAVVTSD